MYLFDKMLQSWKFHSRLLISNFHARDQAQSKIRSHFIETYKFERKSLEYKSIPSNSIKQEDANGFASNARIESDIEFSFMQNKRHTFSVETSISFLMSICDS